MHIRQKARSCRCSPTGKTGSGDALSKTDQQKTDASYCIEIQVSTKTGPVHLGFAEQAADGVSMCTSRDRHGCQ